MVRIKSMFQTAAVVAALFAGTTAWAHSDDYLDTQKAPHGGQLRMAGVYHFELVLAKEGAGAADKPVTVYVTDHAGVKIATAGASGTATILAGKAKTTVALQASEDNALKGVGKYASTPDLKAIVSITLAGKPAEQARFTPLAQPVASAEHGEHMH